MGVLDQICQGPAPEDELPAEAARSHLGSATLSRWDPEPAASPGLRLWQEAAGCCDAEAPAVGVPTLLPTSQPAAEPSAASSAWHCCLLAPQAPGFTDKTHTLGWHLGGRIGHLCCTTSCKFLNLEIWERHFFFLTSYLEEREKHEWVAFSSR